jgi:chromate transport protein ChrA
MQIIFLYLQMFNRLYETQLDKISRIDNLKNLILATNPISFILIFPAIIYMFKSNKTELYKPLAFSISLSSFLLLLLTVTENHITFFQ